jgi:hypothetical protein
VPGARTPSVAEVPELGAFADANPDFDIIEADLLRAGRLDTLRWEGVERDGTLALLRRLQRVLRVEPDLPTARVLLDEGFDSAHRIASLARSELARRLGPKLDGGAAHARRIHDAATMVASRAAHLAANVHALVGSVHFRALSVNHIADDIPERFQELASYAEIFGSLDYCECPECGSVLGPAAYLVDLLRIVDKAIITPSKEIPKGLTLDARRPDIAAIPLTCANTNDEVPYLQIVNGALEQLAVRELGVQDRDAAYGHLAHDFYPPPLPFNLPLTRIRRYLGARKVTLAEVYSAYSTGPQLCAEEAREILGLTAEEVEHLAPPGSGASELQQRAKASYGLPATGSDLGGLEKLDTFMGRTGLTHDEVRELLAGGLGPGDLDAGGEREEAPPSAKLLAHSLFVNHVLPSLGSLYLAEREDSKDGSTYTEIANQSLATLDTLDRFVRLARAVGWSFGELDWTLTALRPPTVEAGGEVAFHAELDATMLADLARVVQLVGEHGLPLALVNALCFDLKTTGRGEGEASLAPFDQIFNDAGLLARSSGRAVYRPQFEAAPVGARCFPNPLYTDPVLTWKVGTSAATSAGELVLASIPCDRAALQVVASALFDAEATVQLTVPNLSALYRHTLLAEHLNLSASAYVTLSGLLGFAPKKGALPATLSPHQALELVRAREWIASCGLRVEELAYIVSGTAEASVTTGYDPARLPAFLATLAQTVKPTLLDAASLQSPRLPAAVAKAALEALAKLGFVDAAGVVAGEDPSQARAALEAHPPATGALDTAQLEDVVGRLAAARAQQETHLASLLAALLGIPADAAATLADGVARWRRLTGGPVALLLAAATSGSLEPALKFLDALAPTALLMSRLSLSAAAMSAIFRAPRPFGIADDGSAPLAFTLDAVRIAHQYAQLRSQCRDSGDVLAAYLASTDRPLAQLCLATGWDPVAVSALCEQLLDKRPPETVESVSRMARILAIATACGVDVGVLHELSEARAMPASGAAWTAAGDLADRLLQALSTGTPPERSAAALVALEAPLLEARRDALVPMAIDKLSAQWSDIATARGLYEYLLLDVEMAGCAQISPIREALNATQLYLQRCRLNLERGVAIKPEDLPEVWWEWLLDYRVWEANREIFLYPENYIDPSLRSTRTKPFRELQDSLLQGPMTDDSVSAAFHKYLDAFAEVARLTPIDSYHATVHDAAQGAIDTLFIFSRTSTEPYKFYYATRQRLADAPTGDVWSQWLPIDITVNSPYITPVHVFDKLHILWIELQQRKESEGSTGSGPTYPITLATIKLSYRNLSGEWVQPQTILSEQVVDVGAEGIHGPFAPLYENQLERWWTKVAAVRIPGSGPGSGAGGERLCVYFGPLPDASGPTTPSAKEPGPNPQARNFYQTIAQAQSVTDQLVAFKLSAGRVPINPTLVLDSNLNQTSLVSDGQYLIVRPDERTATSPPTFRAGLSGSALVIQPDRESIFNGYVAGTGVVVDRVLPVYEPFDNTSFESDLVSAAESASHFKALCAENWINRTTFRADASGLSGLTLDLLRQILERESPVGNLSVPILREIKERFLAGVYGTPLLFSALSTRTAAITPAGNQPGMLLLTNSSETFLIEAGEPTVSFPTIDAAVVLTSPFLALTPESFFSRDITLAESRAFYNALRAGGTKAPIEADGKVSPEGKKAELDLLEKALHTDLGRAQQVRAKLLSNAGPASIGYAASTSSFLEEDNVYSLQFQVSRLSTSAVDSLERALYTGGLDALLALPMQQLPVTPTLPFAALGPSPSKPPATPLLRPPKSAYGDQVEFDGPFGLYYWELFFHAPFLVANTLRDNQQFEAAERWFQYIFNPTLPPDPLSEARFTEMLPHDIPAGDAKTIYGALLTSNWIDAGGGVTTTAITVAPSEIVKAVEAAAKTKLCDETQAEHLKNLLVNRYLAKPTGRYWQFQPFRNQTLETLEAELENCAELAAYNEDPFDPHAIARLRIGAYEKSIVMAYIGNLIDWGDREFSQYTWESVTTARMLYSYAYDLLGPRPRDVGQCKSGPPTTFAAIRTRYANAEIPQFLIDLEHQLGGAQAQGPLLATAGRAYNDLGHVFAVPENQQLVGLWDRVEDRLYKIHNCMNLAGQREPLALWDPPLNPADLVRAAAAGGFAGPEQQLHPIVPNYRFTVTIARAQELAETVRSFGAALLGALERRDAEGLALVRAGQELGVLNMVTATRQSAVTDLTEQVAALHEALAGAEYRSRYYADLISDGLNAAEIANLVLTGASLYERAAAIPFHGLSIAGYMAPNIFGFADGGMQFGEAIGAGATIATTISEMLSQSATLAQTVGQNQRRAQEWQLQRQSAEYDTGELKKQIAAAEARLAAAQREFSINAQEIANAARVESLMRSNFTNQDLYTWMTGRIATVYFQAFRLASEMAFAAQTAYRFELGRDEQFIAPVGWDSLHQGLLAGDGLLLSLQQLEKAYLDADSRQLEIEKTISLRQTFPSAFAGFRWGHPGGAAAPPGQLDFTLTQALFDFDYPGHYNRKIKSVSLSLPSVIGPYQDFHVTLTQNSNLVVLKPDASAVEDAIARINGDAASGSAGAIRENWAPNQSIAVSRGVDDAGLFALDFRDERYLPFEGTGAVSSWTLSMPPDTNRIDFDSITDVILKVRYTARDGGSDFASQVRRLYADRERRQPPDERYSCLNAAVLNFASAFSAQWGAVVEPPIKDGETRTVAFPLGSSAILPNLGAAKLHCVLIQLEVAGDPIGGKTALSLQIDGQPSPAEPIEITDNFGEVPLKAIETHQHQQEWEAFTDVQWTLQFHGGAFDASKLVDATIAIVYSAQPFAST